MTTPPLQTQSGLTVTAECQSNSYEVTIELKIQSLTAQGDVRIHWGLRPHPQSGWVMPPASSWPPNTVPVDASAVQTPLCPTERIATLTIRLPVEPAFTALEFVLYFPESHRWDNNHHRNYTVPIPSRTAAAPKDAAPTAHPDIVADIVRCETTHQSWTLMHRFNLCHDLLDRVRGSLDGYALLYVYLRYSAIRQLTWQRRYNTKPRELAHAQDRLTRKLSEIYRHEPAHRALIRLTLATVGPGGEGQRIRDEILNIMHRHHIKEVSGHFLEEWHQKLHNNTTPDDLVICEAFLAFQQSHGNLDVYHQTLQAGGVTPERLQSFERPIRSHPHFVPHLRDALIHDFQHFLRILKASHAGTDLEMAIQAARHHLGGDLHARLDHIWQRRNTATDHLLDTAWSISEVRRRLAGLWNHSTGLRELLYLDLALEQLLRAMVERNIHLNLNGDQLADLTSCIIENVTLSYEDGEMGTCLRHWWRLQADRRFDAPWSLHAKSVVDRLARTLSAWIDRLYQLLQPCAETLGRGFQAEPWTIALFSEEVVRGCSLGFILSMLLRHLDPSLRRAAHLSTWQIISRGQGFGRVEVVDSLRSIQGRRFDSPVIVLAEKIAGDEEIPEGVTAVIAPDVVDIVSHVAVRARNARVLFASCHDPEQLRQLQSRRGSQLQLTVTPAGDVEVRTDAPVPQPPARLTAQRVTPPAAPTFVRHAIPLPDFHPTLVGAKSGQQLWLRGRLPDWIHLAPSAAVPFGVCEHALGLPENRSLAQQYSELARQLSPEHREALPALRDTVLALNAPPPLSEALRQAMQSSGVPWPDDWDRMWHCIKQVWASKWNERAFLSRVRVGLPHESLTMAVLLQQVVPADYAFVIHTVNPTNGNPQELLAEVVLGLGETLVSNEPGRALSFVWDKRSQQATVLSYPSKSHGLYGEGLILRSDSNGEDLPGYAGAGLYDSVLLRPPQRRNLDYSQEPLLWDERFRQNLMATIGRIGLAVEAAHGSPQDVEGAISRETCHVVQTRPQVGLA